MNTRRGGTWIPKRAIGWLRPHSEHDAAPAYVGRTCTTCGLRYALDPLELKKPPAPRDRWVCSACRKKARAGKNLFGWLGKE